MTYTPDPPDFTRKPIHTRRPRMVGIVVPTWVCEEVSNQDGTYSLKALHADDKWYWMTIELNGSISFRQPADEEHRGPWESFIKEGNLYIELPKAGVSRDLTKVAG